MKYLFGLDPATDRNINDYIELYRGHYGQQVRSAEEVVDLLRQFHGNRILSHFSCAKLVSGEPVAAMGVILNRQEDGDVYVFSHLVTHTDHRQKGLAKNVITYGARMLMALNPLRIHNHKRMNVIPQRYFEELGFVEKEISLEEMPEYRWVYTWDNLN